MGIVPIRGLAWREIRVFISSTFRDMQAERDHLVRFVFPRLREELVKHRISIVDVDLRWGVTTDQNAFDLCMDEIDRCRPRFICMLGGRYGCVPPPRTVPFEVMRRIRAGTSPSGVLSPQEERALAVLYMLEPDGKMYRYRSMPTGGADQELWDMYNEVALKTLRHAGLPAIEESITAAEVKYAVLDRPDDAMFAYFYLRDPAVTEAIPAEFATVYRESPGSLGERALAELKANLNNSSIQATVLRAPGEIVQVPLKVYVYSCEWDPVTARLKKLQTFGERVYADLLASVEAEYGTIPASAPGEFADESAAVESFVTSHVDRFVIGSRKTVLDQLRLYAESEGPREPLCLCGPSGIGKSALLCRFYRDSVEQRGQGGPLVIGHFVGTSARSTSARQLLRRLCHELAVAADLRESMPDSYEELLQIFPSLLGQVSGKRRVVLIIDAIDQLNAEPSRVELSWIPETLPKNARIIFSLVPGSAMDALRERLQRPSELMLELLEDSDAEMILEFFLQRYRKTLDGNQKSELLKKSQARLPLYLVTALAELRTLGTYEEITARIRQLPGKIPALLNWVLNRLESDDGFRNEHGKLIGEHLVRRYCSFIAISRFGMAEAELLRLVAGHEPASSAPVDPQGHQAALSRLLRPHLIQRGELIDFSHDQVRSAVWQRYLSRGQVVKKYHSEAAGYFLHRADPTGEGTWMGRDARALSELPYHQTQGGLWQDVMKTLADLAFIERKCAAGLTYELMEDYSLLSREPSGDTFPSPNDSDTVRLFSQFVSAHAHVFARDATQVLPMAYNYADAGPVVDQAERKLGEQLWAERPWIKLANRPPLITRPALLRTLEGHYGAVTAVALAEERRTIASGGSDGTIVLWDLETGRRKREFRPHDGGVLAVALTPDGRLGASGGQDGLVAVWEDSGTRVVKLSGHKGPVHAVALAADGAIAVSGGEDGTVRVWDLRSEQLAKTMDGHFSLVSSVTLTTDGTTAISGSWDCGIRIWDVRTGCARGYLEGHVVRVQSVASDASATVIVSGSGLPADAGGVSRGLEGSEVRIWHADGSCILRHNPHSTDLRHGLLGVAGNMVFAVAMTPDGRVALSGGYDATVCVWDARNGQVHRRLSAHTGSVLALDVNDTGTLAVSGSEDHTVRVWDLTGWTPESRKVRGKVRQCGRSKRVALAKKALLLLQNTHARYRLVYPLLSLFVGLISLTIPGEISGFTATGPIARLIQVLSASIMAGFFLFSVTWRSIRKGDQLVWQKPIIPDRIASVIALALAPLCGWFEVYDCPVCASEICVRRRMFCCPVCGWQE